LRLDVEFLPESAPLLLLSADDLHGTPMSHKSAPPTASMIGIDLGSAQVERASI